MKPIRIYEEKGEHFIDDRINGVDWHRPSDEPNEEIDNWMNT